MYEYCIFLLCVPKIQNKRIKIIILLSQPHPTIEIIQIERIYKHVSSIQIWVLDIVIKNKKFKKENKRENEQDIWIIDRKFYINKNNKFF